MPRAEINTFERFARILKAGCALMLILGGCDSGPPAPVSFIVSPVTLELRPHEEGYVDAQFEIEPGWHIYSQKTGPYARPTTLTLTAPQAIRARVMDWPETVEFTQPGDIKAQGYNTRLSLRSALAAENGAMETIQEVTLAASWLACADICVPGKAERKVSVILSKR